LSVLALLTTSFASCAAGPPAQERVEATPSARALASPPRPVLTTVVLVALDGVRWQEVFRGIDPVLAEKSHMAQDDRDADLAPNIHRLIATRGAALGADGAEIRASGPNFVSLPGYTEMLTGRRSACRDNDCAPIDRPTLLDELAASSPSPLAVISSWERIERVVAREPGRVVVSAGRTHGATRDALRYDGEAARLLDDAANASSWPGGDDFRRDAATGAIALRYLREKRPRFLFLGLGEPDEFAHQGDYPGYVGAIRAADRIVGELVRALDDMADRSPAALFVTTDHGRAASFRDHGGDWPESSRVWLVGAGAGISARGVVPMSLPHHLADIGPTIRALFGLARDESRSAGSVIDELVTTGAP